MQLADLQKDFTHALLSRRETQVAEFIHAGAIDEQQRLAIYRTNVYENLTDVLADTFAATHALVGPEFFRTMARHYIAASPPRAACLLWFGDDFASFIEDYAPAQSVPYLADMARFEWAWHSAYFAEDDVSLQPEVLDALDEAALRILTLHLRECASVIYSDYPLDALWRYAKNPENIPPPDMEAGGGCWLIWRPEREVILRPLTEAEYTALCSLKRGATLEAMIHEAGENDPSALLERLFQLRVLCHPDHVQGE